MQNVNFLTTPIFVSSPQMLLVLFLIVVSSVEGRRKEEKPNVGTVLFTDADTMKDCWSMESLALLTSRMVLEDLLPSQKAINLNDAEFVPDIIEYFRLILEVVRKMTYGKSKHVMLMALTDVLGGYLNHLVLPMAKYAYYSGNIDYDTVKKLYQLFDELKCFLRTNGKGWAKPIHHQPGDVKAKVIPRQPPSTKSDPCKGLIYYEGACAVDSSHQQKPEEEPKKTSKKKRNDNAITIPLPFFDSKTHPCAIAVPFKTYSLRNVESKASVNLLVKYYVASYKCLTSKNVNPKNLEAFESNLFGWIRAQVLPRLEDEKFYAAFGGIYRIVETLRQEGVGEGKEISNYNIMGETQIKDGEGGERMPNKNVDEGEEATGADEPTMPAISEIPRDDKKKSSLILIALLCTIFIWFLLGSMFICYRMRANRDKKKSSSVKEIEALKPCKCGQKHSAGHCPFGKDSKGSLGSKKSKSSNKCTAMILRRKKTSSGMTKKSSGKVTSESEESARYQTKALVSRRSIPQNDTNDSIVTIQTTDEDANKMLTRMGSNQSIESSSKASARTKKSSAPSSRRDIKFSEVQMSDTQRVQSSQSVCVCDKESKKRMHQSRRSCFIPSRIPTPRKRSTSRGKSLSRATRLISTKKRSPSSCSRGKKSAGTTCPSFLKPCSPKGAKKSTMSQASGHISEEVSTDDNEQVQIVPCAASSASSDIVKSQIPLPTRCACHSSISGVYTAQTSQVRPKMPFVFGYDFETTSSENTGDGGETTEGEDLVQANLSK